MPDRPAVRREIWRGGVRSISIVALALVVLALCLPARARVDDQAPFDLRYGMYWGGLQVADVWLRYEPNGTGYRSMLGVETVGLAELLLRYRGTATSEGRRADADLLPEAYRFRDTSRKATTTAEVIFDPATGAAVHVDARKRGEPRPMEVPRELWADVLDPLTAFLRLRQELGALRQGEPGRLVLPVFDGRRRYDLVAKTKGRERASIAGRQWDALRVELTVKPIAGFNENDLEEGGYGDGGLRIDALISDDDRMIPLQLRTRGTPVNIVFTLREACPSPSACNAGSG